MHTECLERIEVSDAPDPMIVKFARMEEREMVYRARTQLPVTSKMSVRTDLPADLKRKRGALSQIAYTMRKKGQNANAYNRESEGCQT